MNIVLKNDSERERKVAEILRDLFEEYDLPTFTENIVIEEGAVPHSHPILTLNTRTLDTFTVMQVFIHEQFHWYATQHPEYQNALEALKEHSRTTEVYKNQDQKESFLEHLIVCFNTRNTLTSILTEEEVSSIYSAWQAYPEIEKFVLDEWEKIKKVLELHSLLYSK